MLRHHIARLRRIRLQIVQLEPRHSRRQPLARLRKAPPTRIGNEQQLPTTLPDRERTIARVMDQSGPLGQGRVASADQRKHAHAVLSRVLRQRHPEDFRAGCHQVQMSHRLPTPRPRRCLPRPPHDERYPMPAFEQVRLVPAIPRARIMPESLQLRQVRRRRESIVRGEHHQRVRPHSQAVQRPQQLSDRRIHLEHEIPVGIGLRTSLERRSRHDRRVG